MDNAMLKRGIGAVVLAIIAALLLGYLLKDKSSKRLDVVKQEMNLPGSTSSTIPSLSNGVDNAGTVVADGVDSAAEGMENAANGAGDVVATTAGAGAAMTAAAGNAMKGAGNTADNVVKNANQMAANTTNGKPGFSIRPAGSNEQREIIDINGKVAPDQPASVIAKKSAKKSTKRQDRNGSVVASATGKQSKNTYRPRLIKERKRTRIVASARAENNRKEAEKAAKKKAAKKKALAAKATAKAKAAAAKAKTAVAATSSPAKSSRKGRGYSIQLMATSSQSRASKLKSTMKSEGYTSYITKTSQKGKVLYRVRIGVRGNRNSAIALQSKMKRRYRKNFFVQNSLVVSN